MTGPKKGVICSSHRSKKSLIFGGVTTPCQTNFKPVGFWAPRTAVNVPVRPRLWRNIRHAPVSVRFEESDWSQFPEVVRWSYSPAANDGRICLSFTSKETYFTLAYRWRAVANALWRMISSHTGVSFREIPVDISDCFDASVPASTFRFAKLPSDPHDLIPNAYFLDRRHRLPPPLPWEQKQDTIYFRSSLTGTVQSRENPRAAACLVARTIPDADCKLTMFQQTPAELRAELEQEGITCRRDRVNALNSHRYLLDIDGNSSSWHRFWLIGMFRSVLIRFETQWQECWHDVIRDGEHYVSATRHNLREVIADLRIHPKKAREIANAAAGFVRDSLSSDGSQRMFEKAWLRRIDAE